MNKNIKKILEQKKKSKETNKADEEERLRNDQANIEWDKLETMYGKSMSQAIENPLQIHKKLIGTEKKLVKPKEPMALIQKKDAVSEWKEAVTQGVLDYEGSDGTTKRVWVNKKFLSTMIWGNDTVRYYNITEDSFIPNGTTNTLIEFEDLQKIMNKQALNHEKLKADEYKSKGGLAIDIAKAIGVVLLAVGAVLIGGKMFGVDILGTFFANNPEVTEKAANAAVNATKTISATNLP